MKKGFRIFTSLSRNTLNNFSRVSEGNGRVGLQNSLAIEHKICTSCQTNRSFTSLARYNSGITTLAVNQFSRFVY